MGNTFIWWLVSRDFSPLEAWTMAQKNFIAGPIIKEKEEEEKGYGNRESIDKRNSWPGWGWVDWNRPFYLRSEGCFKTI